MSDLTRFLAAVEAICDEFEPSFEGRPLRAMLKSVRGAALPAEHAPPDVAIDAIRELQRYYKPFTPLTDDEVKRGADALIRELGEWGCDRMHAQWARILLENAVEAAGRAAVSGPQEGPKP